MRIKKIPITLRRRGDVIYPKTVAKQIVFEDGKDLEEKWVEFEEYLTPPDYLTLEATVDGTTISAGYGGGPRSQIEASVDNGRTWTTYMSNNPATTIASLNAGDKVMLRSTDGTGAGGAGCVITADKDTYAYGNMMSLLYGEDFEGKTTFPAYTGLYSAFGLTGNDAYNHIISHPTKELTLPATTIPEKGCGSMFLNCKGLKRAPTLPATTLGKNCYDSMFKGCSALEAAPELPATTLASSCYSSMFYGCEALTAAPELPATTLASGCYYQMFCGCSALTTAPELPATTLESNCYSGMFSNCEALTTAPELPATTLASGCYDSMFKGCSALTTAPELPATTLASSCYSSMFYGCEALTAAPELPATTLASMCYGSMFYNCKALTTAPDLPAPALVSSCYMSMFYGCSNLNSIKCLAESTVSMATMYWMASVSPSGTFTKKAGVTFWSSNSNGIPSGWTVVEE